MRCVNFRFNKNDCNACCLPRNRDRQRQQEEAKTGVEGGRGRGRGATSLASQEAVSWQSSVRATCEMPIYSLANIASDRTTTARTPQWRLKLPLTSMPSRLWLWLWIWLWVSLWFECQCNICRHDCQDTKAHGATDSLWQLCLTLTLTLPRSGYWIMCKNLKCKQLYAFIVSLGRRPPLKLLLLQQQLLLLQIWLALACSGLSTCE